jgi:hypothetical protein
MYYYQWSGGRTIVVQIGDQNDSCRPIDGKCDHIEDDKDDDISIFMFFTMLHSLALKVGGGVYSLIGNHELMNIKGDLRYVSNENINKFTKYKDPFTKEVLNGTAEENFKHAFLNGNEYANLIGCTRQSVLIIGDFLFIHAGINKEFLNKFRGRDELQDLNELVKNWIVTKLTEFKSDPRMEMILNDANNSPFWMRVLGQLPANLPENNNDCRTLINPIIEAYKIKGMVIGHTPQINMENGANKNELVNGINGTCGNKLFRIDVGASKAFLERERREPQVLEIERMRDGTYKYKVIFQEEDVYESIVPDDITSFGRMESRLPN